MNRGAIVIMNRLPMHKVAGVRELIGAVGARLRYLPKYSPDLNPIEQAFSKLKAHLRKAAELTIPRLSRRIGALMAKFSSWGAARIIETPGCPSLPARRGMLALGFIPVWEEYRAANPDGFGYTWFCTTFDA